MKKFICTSLFLGFMFVALWAMHPIDTLEAFSVAPGCDYMAIRWMKDDSVGINSFILRVNAKEPSVSFQQRLAKDKLIAREKLTHMVYRFNEPLGTNPVCIAAVNGDFFWMANEAQENGLVRGWTIQDNEIAHTCTEQRLLGGMTEDKLGFVGSVGEWTGAATIHDVVLPINHVNYHRTENELVLYNRFQGHSTKTDSLGTEVLLELLPGEEWHTNCRVQARVIDIEKEKGNMRFAQRQVVLSGNGEMAQALDNVQIGDVVTIDMTFTVDGEAMNISQCIGSDQYATILKNGVVEMVNFWPDNHPRNAFGFTMGRDTLFFVIVDGRIPVSPGCTTSELGEMMRQLGCYNATNWDGGRSAHLWLRGHGIMNMGCENKERAIANGMFIFSEIPAHTINRELDSLLHADPTRVGGNYHGYDFADFIETPAPKGYAPFYISHYGRHGSRAKQSSKAYEQLCHWLLAAQKDNNLTAAGEHLLNLTQDLITQYDNMPHRLTAKGQREHTQLAKRMYEHYPQVFNRKDAPEVGAISSKSDRCLVSMNAFTNQLVRMNPQLTFHLDCGSEFQKVISPASDDPIAQCGRTRDSLSALLPDDTVAVFHRLFVRPEEMAAKIPAGKLTDEVYTTVVSAQCFDIYANIYDFLPDMAVYNREVKMAWKLWIPTGNNDLQTAYRRPGVQVSLHDIITKADAAIHGGKQCANLRFGHDTQMLSILSAMEVTGVGEHLSPEEVEYKWYTFRELAMGSNFQMIFYAPKKKALKDCSDDGILVKVLYNETERGIVGLTPVNGVYYKWSDIKGKFGV